MKRLTEWTKLGIANLTDGGGPWGNRGGGSGGSGGGSGGGGDGPKNPWNLPPSGGGGRRPGPGGPSALDELIRKFGGMFGGNGPSGGMNGRMIGRFVAGFLVIFLLWTSVHQVGPQEEGVVTRLGKYQGKLKPGIGLTLPSPIDRVRKVDVQAINTENIPDGGRENLILTGDQNIINLAYSVRWNISNAENYIFQLDDPDLTIREVAESAMREVLGNVSLIDAIGPRRSQVEQSVAQRMQTLLNDYRAGVTVRGVAIKQADPPEAVNEAFKAVTVAQQNREANINNANAYAQQIGSRAEGEAGAFDKVYEQYRLAPDVTRRRMYYETMEQILANTDKTIVEPNAIAPYLPLGKGRSGQVTVEEPAK
jgi:modulator of FtsH protease HflK